SVIVLPEIGGISTTKSAREADAAFRGIAGQPLPRIRVPDLAKMRANLRAEFPHLAMQIEVILSELAGKEFVRFRPLLLVSPPGAGKSRFVRRLGECLGVPVHFYDAAGTFDNTFSGTPRRWSSGQPSIPLEAVRASRIANPIV